MRTFITSHLLTAAILAAAFLLLPAVAAAQDGPVDEGKEAYASTGELESSSEQSGTFQPTETYEQRRADAAPPGPPHWMWIVGRSAAWGGMLGALLGVGAYLVTGLEISPWIIAQFAGGGILVGAGIGVLEAAFWTDDELGAQYIDDTPSSVQWIEADLPTTFELQILNLEF